MNPVYLIFDGPHCLVPVKQTHLICFRVLDQQARLLQVVNGVLGDGSLFIIHVKLQISIFGEY